MNNLTNGDWIAVALVALGILMLILSLFEDKPSYDELETPVVEEDDVPSDLDILEQEFDCTRPYDQERWRRFQFLQRIERTGHLSDDEARELHDLRLRFGNFPPERERRVINYGDNTDITNDLREGRIIEIIGGGGAGGKESHHER